MAPPLWEEAGWREAVGPDQQKHTPQRKGNETWSHQVLGPPQQLYGWTMSARTAGLPANTQNSRGGLPGTARLYF